MTLQNYQTANNAASSLAAGISAGAGTLILKTGDRWLFPSTFPFFLTLEQYDIDNVTILKREIVKVTAGATEALTITRGAWSCPANSTATTQTTTAYWFNSGDIVRLKMVGEILADINAELVRISGAYLPLAGGILTGLVKGAKSSNIASATTTDLSTATGNEVHVTGTTTITGFGTVTAGTAFDIIFDWILTLTHNASTMILPNAGSNITTAAGDSARIVSEGGWAFKCTSYTKANGSALVATSPGSATNAAQGIIRIALDSEVETATDQSTATNPYQLGLYRNIPEQDLPYYAGTTIGAVTNGVQVWSSGVDDGVFFLSYTITSTVTIMRYKRQALSGHYVCTHQTTYSTTSSATRAGLAVVGSNLYMCVYDAAGGGAKLIRYAAADLSWVQAMTVSGTWFGTIANTMFTDGTNLYIFTGTSGADAQFNKYSISGTTYTFVSTITYTSGGNIAWNMCGACCDWTNVYSTVTSNGQIDIKKYALAGGAVVSTTTHFSYNDAYADHTWLWFFIPRKWVIGIGFWHAIWWGSGGSVIMRWGAMKLYWIAQP